MNEAINALELDIKKMHCPSDGTILKKINIP